MPTLKASVFQYAILTCAFSRRTLRSTSEMVTGPRNMKADARYVLCFGLTPSSWLDGASASVKILSIAAGVRPPAMRPTSFVAARGAMEATR